MRGYPYLRNRNGYFYFRIAVPRALRNGLGKGELLYSLKTKDFSKARIRGGELYQSVAGGRASKRTVGCSVIEQMF